MVRELHWAGKTFRGVDDVDPIVVYRAIGCGTLTGDTHRQVDRFGVRIANAAYLSCELREISYGGQNTIAMVYDAIDYFRGYLCDHTQMEQEE